VPADDIDPKGTTGAGVVVGRLGGAAATNVKVTLAPTATMALSSRLVKV